jgi:hydroxymethylbilane synthase
MKHIRIGSRESRLAVIQSEIVIKAIHQWDSEIQTELVTMKTTGDVILDRTLDKIGGKGLFVKELDAALLDGRVDLTVHSSKDLPMETDPRLPLVAFSKRADPRDVLVLPENMDTIDFTKPIGCSSLRRQLQLRALFPEATVAPVRGNVLTRLQKLDSGEFSALVLAGAGLARLGLEHRISRYFSVEEILPAAGQGILAVQAREGADTSCLGAFADEDGRDCLLAERAFVRTLDGGCSSPVAAFATVEGDTLTLKGMYVTPDEALYFQTISGPREQGKALGAALAEEMRRDHQ